ncbi:cytochrome P450 26A1-like isoform X2 [Dreissena polymorpha]|uniref:cytochrome P450 26A1-like isoform X2 n=1 Tax=Dreissena polymorpha TaxID=45954 RepID=UPI002263B793|nr:cytochrome P450 26A1-like isoform X2 [Dreissena polymorpha]
MFKLRTLNYLQTAFFKKRHDKYGQIFKTRIFGRNVVRVFGMDNVRKVIYGENRIVRSSYPASVLALVGNQSVSMMHGEEHKEKKRQLMKFLNPDFFNSHTPALYRTISQRIQEWKESPAIDLHHECRRLFVNLAAKFLINIDISDAAVAELAEQLQIFMDNMFCLPWNIPGFGFYKAIKAKERMRQIIASSLTQTENNNKSEMEFSSVLQGLCSTSGDDDVSKNVILLDSIIDLLFAGAETVTSAGFSLAYQLAKHDDVMDKLRHEIASLDLKDTDDVISARDIQPMKYVNAVVKETLRLLPPVGGAFRTALESFELDGFTIPKGWSVSFGIRDTHNRDPVINDPMTFNPDQWLTNTADSFAYLPFGGGARVCPGQAYAKMILKLFTVEFARSCSIDIVQDSDLSFWPTPRPSGQMLVSIRKC